MNARLHHRLHAEESILGPYIFGRGLEYLHTVSETTLENRTIFAQFSQQLGLNEHLLPQTGEGMLYV